MVKRQVMIRNLAVGDGRPRIIVPVAGRTEAEIRRLAEEAAGEESGLFDLVEWRADYYEDVLSPGSCLETALMLKEILGEVPVLFTFRTKREGGEMNIPEEVYAYMLRYLASEGAADAFDVEMFGEERYALQAVEDVHGAGRIVVGSWHDFHRTPPKEEIIRRLCRMQEMGADILKIAVMPGSREDVAVLLAATAEMREMHAERPLMTMSMGSLGVISRMAGEAFGSAMTFGALSSVSAPGQMPAGELKKALDILHSAMCGS